MDVVNAVIGPQIKLLIAVITAFNVLVQHLFIESQEFSVFNK
jgi:hypothetical protein